MSENYEVCVKIVTSTRFDSEAAFNTCHDFLEVWFDDSVKDLAAVLVTVEEPAPLHQPEVFRCHGGGKSATFRQFTDGILAGQEHLNHPQPMRMRQHAEAFRSMGQTFQTG
jgi:hypothetical protein